MGDPVRPVGLPELEQGFDDDEPHDPQEHAQQTGAIPDGDVVVQRHPDEIGPNPGQSGQQDHHDPRQDEPAAVGLDLRQDAAKHLGIENLAGGFGGGCAH